MLDLLRAEEGASTLSLTFVLDGRRARLTEGERFLELAARASVRSTG
jgi:hypothetical protein